MLRAASLVSRLSCLSISAGVRSAAPPALASALARPAVAARAQAAFHSSAWQSEKKAAAKPATKKAASKPKAAGRKSTAAKKKTTKAKAKPKPKKKKVAAKPKPKAPVRPKRVLSPPKRAVNAWMLFYKEKLAAMPQADKSGRPAIDISQEVVSEYRALSPEQKEALERRVQEAKVQYEKDLQEYMSNVTPQMIADENAYRRAQRKKNPSKKNPRFLRDETKPRPPLNPYIRFVTAVRADPSKLQSATGVDNFTALPIGEQGKALAQAWRNLSEAEKKRYTDAYAADKEKYDESVLAWKEENALA